MKQDKSLRRDLLECEGDGTLEGKYNEQVGGRDGGSCNCHRILAETDIWVCS